MFPYILSLGLIEATRFIKLNSKPKRFFVTLFCGCILIALVGLRHPSMGNDLRWYDNYGYLGGFQRIAVSDWGLSVYQNYEIGYIVFNKIVSLFTVDNQIFLIVCAACSILPFIYIIYRDSADIQTSFILLFGTPVFTLFFSGLRQSLAIGILMFSFNFIKQKKMLPFLFIVIIASLFHSSAVLFILAYPLYNYGKLLDRRILIRLLIIVFILRRPLLTTVGSLITSKNAIDNNGSVNLFFACVALLVIFLIVTKDNDEEINGMLKIYYLSCICMAFSSINRLAMRGAFYFVIILVVLVPCLYDDSKLDTIKTRVQPKGGFIFLINMVFIALGMFYIFTTEWAHAYPYYFFWE